MSVRRRKNGTYQVRISTPTGRIERTLPKGATRQDAKAYEGRLQLELVGALVGKKTDPTIEELIVRWLKNEAKRNKDYHQMVLRCRALQPYFTGKTLSQIVTVADAFIKAKLAQKRKHGTINRHLAILRRVANLAFRRWDLADQNWGVKLQLLKEEGGREVFLSPAQVKSLASACTDPNVADAILLASMCGLRKGELLRLTAASLKDGALLVPPGKTGRGRIVPLPAYAQEIADRALPWKFTPDELRYRFEEARVAADMPHVRIHDLRHTYASWVLQSGASVVVARDLLGHASITTTNKYVHSDLAMRRAAVEQIGSGLGQNEKGQPS